MTATNNHHNHHNSHNSHNDSQVLAILICVGGVFLIALFPGASPETGTSAPTPAGTPPSGTLSDSSLVGTILILANAFFLALYQVNLSLPPSPSLSLSFSLSLSLSLSLPPSLIL